MLSRLTRGQLIAFVVLTLFGLAYASVVYVKLPRQIGIGRYQVAVDLPNLGDLYQSAAVTLRGEEIGEVTDLNLTDNAVRATLSINDEAKIPADALAQVRSVSALGEQYLNFVPRSEGGPALAPGAVVPATQVELPVPEDGLLDKVNALVASLPKDSLNTTIDELGTGFGGTGADIERLIDSSDPLLATASANLASTRGLISDLEPFLNTQRRLSPELLSLTSDLAGFTDRLRRSDADLRGTIDKVPAFTGELDKLVDDLRPTLPGLLHDLTKVGEVARVYLPNVRHVLLVLPTTVHDLQSAIDGSPVRYSANLNFKAVLNNPPPCTVGFLTERRNVNDFSPRAPAYSAFCKDPNPGIVVRRGTSNECPNDHSRRSNEAYGCGLNFQDRRDYERSRDEATETMLKAARDFPTHVDQPKDAPPFQPIGAPSSMSTAGPPALPLPDLGAALAGVGPESTRAAAPAASGYDPGTGVFLAPDGQPYILGNRSSSTPKPGTPAASDWRSLLLAPMGLANR